jgi:DNA-binding GntR family transcriptional regulator
MIESLDSVESIARDSVEDRAAQALRELIVRGQLPEATPLVQRDLAQRLGVSQTPIRLALSELERGGLVSVGATGRAFVSRLTREDLEEIYAARRGLEGLAARVGTAALGQAELARMLDLLRTLQSLARRRDVEGYLRARWDFHATCYAAAQRPRLLAEVELLFWRAERYNRLILSSRKRFRDSLRYHQQFLEACAAGDPQTARRTVEESMQWAVDLIWDSLPAERP